MKRTFKALVATIIFTLMIAAAALTSYANYDGEESVSAETSYGTESQEIVDAGAANDISEDELDKNVFTSIFNQVKSYATEIFCAMTFIGSLILAYAYKKGLIPMIEKALISIGGSVAKIKERTESGAAANEELGASIAAKLERSEALVNELVDRMSKMNSELSEIKASELERSDICKELSVIVGTQIDMLRDIFMTSALPQYQKDAVGERVAKMKETLKNYDKEK